MELDKKQLTDFQTDVEAAVKKVKLTDKKQELAKLSEQMNRSDFWQDQSRAQTVSKRHSDLTKNIDLWEKLQKDTQDLADLYNLNDSSLSADIKQQFKELQAQFESSKTELLFSGPYDDHGVVLSIFAGAGGTDAQDWAEMLRRMYLRYAEQHGIKTQILDESTGDEAGIKSCTMTLTGGEFVYGKLKSEHGVHRLVRLSPFNADSLRQTSFARVEVVPKIDQPDELEIDDKDLKIDVYRSGGHGGQSVNTTDSAVRITHLPTGVTVAIQNERSQLQNRETAMTLLRSKLAVMQLEQHKSTVAELKGPNEQAAWGNQIRSYVLHPYTMVKDLRSRFETSNVQTVLDGDLEPLINAYLKNL